MERGYCRAQWRGGDEGINRESVMWGSIERGDVGSIERG